MLSSLLASLKVDTRAAPRWWIREERNVILNMLYVLTNKVKMLLLHDLYRPDNDCKELLIDSKLN